MKPLTIDELKALKVGDWVWIISPTQKGDYYRKDNLSSDTAFAGCGLNVGLYQQYSEYGTKWIAFKNKEQAECKGVIIELPLLERYKYVINGVEVEGGKLVYCRPSGEIAFEWFEYFNLEAAEKRLAELKGEPQE